MKKIIILFFFFSSFGYAQDLVLIKFTDKPSAQTYLSDPSLMLSQKALDRRAKYNIDITVQDVPVEVNYVNQIEAIGISPIAVSKWFNGVFAWCTENQVDQAEALSIVSEVKSFVRNEEPSPKPKSTDFFDETDFEYPVKSPLSDSDYSYTEPQISQIDLDYLHDLGYTGSGISIAVLDNGFEGVDQVPGFDYIRVNGQIKGTHNFVNPNLDVYTGGNHGTKVLSTMGGKITDAFIGTAVDADFYLFVTEDNTHELPDEEVYWVAAAEEADSLGVDVINTSLGYFTYDDSRYDYTYNDMDGETSFIAQGAQIASEKGIMVVIAAGNEGNRPWHYIATPADTKDAFTIGAVDTDNNPASFSSYGPTSDGRLKPNISALGADAVCINENGNMSLVSGTSFASPIIAGAMACLIQAFPNINPADLRQAVEASADHYNNPTDQLGYGIPDFGQAYQDIDFFIKNTSTKAEIKLYPNPTDGLIFIQAKQKIENVVLVSPQGKILQQNHTAQQIDLTDFSSGIYFIKIQLKNGEAKVRQVVKR